MRDHRGVQPRAAPRTVRPRHPPRWTAWGNQAEDRAPTWATYADRSAVARGPAVAYAPDE